MDIDGVRINIGASIGITCFPRDGESIECLYEQADSAMYAAKQKGKNQYCCFQKI